MHPAVLSAFAGASDCHQLPKPRAHIDSSRLFPYDKQPSTSAMPTIDEFWFVAEQVAREHGGLIVGFRPGSDQPAIGSTLDYVLGFRVPRPVSIAAIADYSAWKEQVEAFYRLRPGWGRGKDGDPDGIYYRIAFREASSPEIFRLIPTPAPASSPMFAAPMPTFAGYATPPQGLVGASFAPRAAARIIDLILHTLVAYSAGLLFAFMLVIAGGGKVPAWVILRLSHTRWPLFLAGLLGMAAYQVACSAVSGRSLGKLLWSLQVVQEDGSPCRLASACIREAGYFVDALFFGLIGYSAMRGTDQQQRYGDEWANTIVCSKKNVPLRSRQDSPRLLLGLMLGVILDIAAVLLGLLVQISS